MERISIFAAAVVMCLSAVTRAPAAEPADLFGSDSILDLQADSVWTPPPTREGNRARLLIDGEASFATRLELVKHARQSILIQALIWKGDATGTAVAEALIARKRADPELDIRVIVDAYANIQDVKAQLLFFEMKNAGIEVEGFETLYLHWLNEINLEDWLAGNKRYHEKYWIVDGVAAVVGGMNIGDEYARVSDDPLLIWRDQDVYLQGPIVDDLVAVFEENYTYFKGVKETKPDLFNTDAYWNLWRDHNPGVDAVLGRGLEVGRDLHGKLGGIPAAPPRREPVASPLLDDVRVRFLRARPREGETTIHQAYMHLIRSARSSVAIANAYFVPTEDLQAALIEAAQRGVTVQVLTNSDATNDIPVITKAGRARYLRLIDAGVQVYEWHAERVDEGTLHAKFAVVDGRVTVIGSHNLDPRSQGLNSEDAVLIDDPRIAEELGAYFTDKDLPLADRITREQAVAWVDPRDLPAADAPVIPWTDARFDPAVFEFMLLQTIEGSL